MLLNFTLLNVQGLISKRSNKLQSKEMTQIFQQNDFILLTEIWINELCDISVDGFTVFQLNRTCKKRNAKRDSGGIALYVKSSLERHCVLVKKENDDIIWLKIDKSVLNLTYDLYLCLCYVIPTGSSREALTEISVLERISDYIVEISNSTENCYHVLICGDMNSRTGTENDFVTLDNLNNDMLPEDYVTDDFMARFSEDKSINSNGRKLLDLCKQNGLRICNGMLDDDENVGKFTYVGSTGRSVVDYVICNPALFDVIRKFKVCEPNILSDHCALEFSLCKNIKNNMYTTRREESESSERFDKKYAWDDAKKEQYVFNLHEANSDFINLYSNLMEATNAVDIDENVSCFLEVMGNVCDPLFAKKLKAHDSGAAQQNYTKSSNNPWFDEECQIYRERFYTKLSIYRENKSDVNTKNMVNARSNFKTLIRKKRYMYDKAKTEKLISTKYHNAKAYWRLLKQTANKNIKHSISSKHFADYFKAVNDPDDRFYQVDDDILFF